MAVGLRIPARFVLVNTLAVLAALAGLAGCGDDGGGSSATLSPTPPLTIGASAARPATVVLPADYDITRRYPLVILLHGYGVNGMLQDFVFRLGDRVTRDQFILVLPDGTLNSLGERFWNATPECCGAASSVDDVGYLQALMQEAMAIYAVDPERIRLAGHSNGGYMSYRYACEQPVRIDRIAVLAGSTFLDPDLCEDPRPTSVLHMHGTNDNTILFNANLPPDGLPNKLRTIGAVATVEEWAAINGCAENPAFVERRDHHQRVRDGDDAAETEVYRARNCRSGTSVELWRAVNADHLYLSVNDLWRDDVAAFLSE